MRSVQIITSETQSILLKHSLDNYIQYLGWKLNNYHIFENVDFLLKIQLIIDFRRLSTQVEFWPQHSSQGIIFDLSNQHNQDPNSNTNTWGDNSTRTENLRKSPKMNSYLEFQV